MGLLSAGLSPVKFILHMHPWFPEKQSWRVVPLTPLPVALRWSFFHLTQSPLWSGPAIPWASSPASFLKGPHSLPWILWLSLLCCWHFWIFKHHSLCQEPDSPPSFLPLALSSTAESRLPVYQLKAKIISHVPSWNLLTSSHWPSLRSWASFLASDHPIGLSYFISHLWSCQCLREQR